MSDEEKTEEKASTATPEAAPPKKAPPKRKPVWVCIPVEFEEIQVEDGGIQLTTKRASKYSVTKCPGGKGQAEAVRATLVKHQIDITNYNNVLMFRADPMEFKVDTQVIVRF